MPRTGPRVVWALCVTIETFAPTSALISVDLPLFGAPISATKPQRVAVLSPGLPPSLAILARLPNPFAQEHGKCCRLLGFALVRPLPALGRDAFDLHLGGEAGRVVGTFAGDLKIARQRQPAALRPFLQHGFRVGGGRLDGVELRLPSRPHHALRRLIAGIGENSTEHGLAGVGEDGLFAPAATSGLAAAHQNNVAEVPALGDFGAGLGP